MKTKYLILVLVCLGFTSCNKFLDVKPKGQVIPETVDHFEGMLNNAVQGYFCYFQDYRSDDASLPSDGSKSSSDIWVSANPNNMNHVVRKIFKFDPVPYEAVDRDIMWTETHMRILHFNTVIDYVMTAKGGTEAKKRSLKAEALVQRAMEFYGLVNIYARHYDEATAATEPGIPMFLHPDVSALVPRSTVKEVYDRILDDIAEALPDLPQTPVLGKFRASYPGAIAFLARVHLNMGHYETALDYADEALSYNRVLVDLNGQKVGKFDTLPSGIYTGLSGNSYDWVLNLDNSPVPNANEHPETILARTFQSPYGLGSAANVCMSTELRDLFDQTNDKRYQFWYASGRYGVNCELLYGVKIRMRGDQANIGPGTPEMYLIRAECNARTSQLQAALDDVNDLREHRYATGTHVDKTLTDFNSDAFEVLKFVLEERRRELAFMGFRVTDLKRLNKDPRFAKTITHVTPDGTFTLKPNSNKYLRQLYPGATLYHPDWKLNPVTD